MSQISQNVPNISVSQLTITKCPNFHQGVNLHAEKNQDCVEICGMTEFMRNYAENVKVCVNVRLTPNNAESCGK